MNCEIQSLGVKLIKAVGMGSAIVSILILVLFFGFIVFMDLSKVFFPSLIPKVMKKKVKANINTAKIKKMYRLELKKNLIKNARLIRNIENNFHGIEKLNLEFDEISEINANTFQDTCNLKELAMNNNVITYIEDNSFLNLACLQRLDLFKNQLTQINSNTFNGLTNLKELCLTHNKITYLKTEAFSCLINLEQLDLAYNLIYQINLNTFSSLISLKMLDLKSNKINRIEELSFLNQTKLEMLNISDNNIVEICAKTLQGLINVRNMNLASNPLKFIHENSFEDMLNLKLLTCSEQEASLFDVSLFDKSDTVIKIK